MKGIGSKTMESRREKERRKEQRIGKGTEGNRKKGRGDGKQGRKVKRRRDKVSE